MPATEATRQATTSRRNKRTRGRTRGVGRRTRREAIGGQGTAPSDGRHTSRGCCVIWNSRDDLPGRLEGQWQRRWMPWQCDDGRRTTYDDAVDGVRHYPQRRVNRRALLRRWEANDAAPLRRQLYYAIADLMLREGRRHAVRVRRGRGRRAQIGRNNQI